MNWKTVTMQNFERYNFTLRENDIVRVMKDAQKNGYSPLVIINGEYYNVEFESEDKTDEKDRP